MSGLLTDMDLKLFDALAKSSPNTYIYYADIKKFVSRWSANAVEFFGLPAEILDPASIWDERVHPDDRAVYNESMQAMLRGDTPYHNCEYRIKNAKGEYVWVNCRGYMTYDKDGNGEFFAGIVNNMGTLSKVDAVTGLWTLYGFRSEINRMLENRLEGAAIQLDIRDFKMINADRGYDFGDKTLYTIGQTLSVVCGKSASVYRIDGTQFGICLRGGENEVRELHKKIREKLSDIIVSGRIIHIDFSAAATLFPRDGRYFDSISNNLNYAIANAKQKDAKEIVFYNDDIFEERNRLARLTEAIRKSVENNFDGFRIVMQPIIDAKTGDIHSAEALLRWSHKDFPNIGPMDFVPILEQTGNIIPVGKWVIDKALYYLAEWNKSTSAHKLQCVNVNFSYVQFSDSGLKDYVLDTIRKYGLPPSALVAELTESCRIEHTEQFAKILQSFRDEGIAIALDDFGTGYASLVVLKDTPTDIVKLDHTMTRTIKDRPKDRSLVEFIIKYCNEMDIEVCTEGVENEEILGIVKSAGTGLMQGYYFDKPLEAVNFYEKYIK